MLGLSRFGGKWHWGACGKHPAARDYFKISGSVPAFDALESWVKKGYAAVAGRRETSPALFSWRFWAKGLKKGELISGIVRDSCDSIGRPYPLLILGKGKLKGWEENWTRLPLFFDTLWVSLEYLVSRRLNGVNAFEKAMQSIQSPEDNIRRLTYFGQDVRQHQTVSIDETRLRQITASLAKEMSVILDIDAQGQGDFLTEAVAWSDSIKTYGNTLPNAVFIGGAGAKHYLAMFRRPINTEDFIRLWSVSSM